MSATPGAGGYYSGYSGYPSGGPGADNFPPLAPTPVSNDRVRVLLAAVVALGVLAFGMGFGSSATLTDGWTVRFAVLAAAVAAVGLLPAQRARCWLVAVLAVAGLLDGITAVVTASEVRWAAVVVVVVVAVQAVIAVFALLSADPEPQQRQAGTSPDHWAQLYSQQAYAAYAAYYQQQAATEPAQGQGRAQADGGGTVRARAPRSESANQGRVAERYADHAERYADFPAPQANPGAAGPVTTDSQQSRSGVGPTVAGYTRHSTSAAQRQGNASEGAETSSAAD